MASRAGPNPFTDWDAYQKFKRVGKKKTQENWTLKGWKKPAMRSLTSSLGSQYQIPEDDYQDYMTFIRAVSDEENSENYLNSGKLRDAATPADYVDYAFGKNTKIAPVVQEGCGHIKLLEYSTRYQVLRVTFSNNDSVCAFFRVPMNLAATLMALAQSKTERADGKHLLGVYFWDLVRIRGTVHGTRYKFIYTKDNSTGGLPGRPYGSGGYLYEKETSPNKTIAKQIENYKSLYYDLTSEAEPEKAEQLAKATGIEKEELAQAVLDKIKGLEDSQYDVTRINQSLKVPDDINLGAIQTDKNIVKQRYADSVIRKHNALRNIERSYDSEKVDKLAQELAAAGILGISYNRFVNHFPNAAEQFDYLRARGLIPPNTRFIR